jgi:hypothetical protein
LAVCVNFLFPKFSASRLPTMVRIALLGAVVAGCYGALHDQVSYAISPEYFTKLKFRQFSYADFGWQPQLFAAEVGFLATWWVGLLAGWFVARAGLAEMPAAERSACTVRSFAIILTVAPAAGLAGAVLGVVMTRDGNLGGWHHWRQELGIEDLRAFVIVAYLHAAGYLGALVGLVLSIVYVRRCLARSHKAEPVATATRLRSDTHSSTE